MKRDGIDLLERRISVGPKDIGERVQYSIDEVHHGQRSPQKAQAKLVNTLLRADACHVAQFH
jgi:hypothetical protein